MDSFKTLTILHEKAEDEGLEVVLSQLDGFICCNYCVCVLRLEITGEVDRYTHPKGCDQECDCHKLES